ncbi:hypothetical protein AgCh_040372 [Apium graveolens]
MFRTGELLRNLDPDTTAIRLTVGVNTSKPGSDHIAEKAASQMENFSKPISEERVLGVWFQFLNRGNELLLFGQNTLAVEKLNVISVEGAFF